MTENGTRPILPALTRLYTAFEPCAYTVLRATSGAIMATFGWSKLFVAGGMARDITLFHQLGIEPAVPLAYFTSGLEFFGGIMVAIGLLTRPVAAMLLGELLVILVAVMIPRGTGYQLTVVWIGAYLLILLRGGGRYSIDRLIGREF
jgi:putative oxidoreductase